MLSAVARTPFLNGGPARNHAEQSGVGRAGDDRGVKEMAVNNKVAAAAGRPLHPQRGESPICVS